jgi:hypothetical protein
MNVSVSSVFIAASRWVGNFDMHLDDLRQHEAHGNDQRHHRE